MLLEGKGEGRVLEFEIEDIFYISFFIFHTHIYQWKVAVALATGNSVVVKPPELAPVSVLELGAILKEAGLPDGVYNVVPGYGHTTGSDLAGHKDISKVDFTGGTSTGKTIAKQLNGVKHYCAELGGNCPVVVFPDADSLEVLYSIKPL